MAQKHIVVYPPLNSLSTLLYFPSFALFLNKDTETLETLSHLSPRGVRFPQYRPVSLLKKITYRSKMLFLILKQSMSNKITAGYFLL